MDDLLDGLIEIVVVLLGLFLVFSLIEAFLPGLEKAINAAITKGVSSATNSAVTAAGSAAKGAVLGLGGAVGASPEDVENTFSGNPTDPGYDFFYGPSKFSMASLGGWFRKEWDITTNSALDTGASGLSAGAFPDGTDVANYDPGNWDDQVYAQPVLPPPDQYVQGVIDYLGGSS